MTVVPASSRNPHAPLTLQALPADGDNAFATLISVVNGDGNEVFYVNSSGEVAIRSRDTNARTLDLVSPNPHAEQALRVASGAGAVNLTPGGGAIAVAAANGSLGFYDHAAAALQTGVPVTAAGIHAALVNLGLITA